jgi:hypothetical protein
MSELDYPPGHPSHQGGAPGGVPLPQRGVFATSEVLPLLHQASARMNELGADWKRLREEANEKAAAAKRIRANLIVELRTWGNDVTGQPIKTSAERQEWADADADVQQAELEADLAQTVQMHAREVYHDAQGYFDVLRQMLAVERDEQKREYGGGVPSGDRPF